MKKILYLNIKRGEIKKKWEEYKNNGGELSYQGFYSRLKRNNYNIDNPPYKKTKHSKGYKKIWESIEQPKCSYSCFCKRVNNGMNYKEAAYREYKRLGRKVLQKNKEIYDYYHSHSNPQVSYETYRARIRFLKRDKETAISKPKMKKFFYF